MYVKNLNLTEILVDVEEDKKDYGKRLYKKETKKREKFK